MTLKLIPCVTQKGSQYICVESPGVHEIQFSNSCISFGSSSTKIDTLNLEVLYCSKFGFDHSTCVNYLYWINFSSFFLSNICQPIYLRGEKYLLKGKINVDPVSLGVYELPESILLNIVGAGGNVVANTEAKLTSDANNQPNSALYEYSVWASSGEELTFVPLDTRSAYF